MREVCLEAWYNQRKFYVKGTLTMASNEAILLNSEQRTANSEQRTTILH